MVPHGLGQTPKALILWTDGKTNENFSASFLFGLGMTDGTNSRSVATASLNGASPSNASQRVAVKALAVVQWGEALLAEADLASWNATSFTLNWTTNNATAYVIHFIAIGGSGVSAKVADWTMPTTLTPPDQPVTVAGIGFQPDVVLHAHAAHNQPGPLPTLQTQGRFGLGVMDKAGHQWATDLGSRDNVNPSDTQRGQVTDACIYAGNPALGVDRKASFVSMNADGFTVNFTQSANAIAAPVISLALKGVAAKAGSFLKSTAAPPATPYVQSRSQDFGSTASATITLPAASTTGNLVVVTVGYGNETATVSSVVDNKGNTYRRAAGPSDWGVNTYRNYSYYAKNITGGGAPIQVTITLSGNSGGVFVVYATEFRGLDTVDPLDQVIETAGTGNPAASGYVTTTYPDELLYAVCGNEGGFTSVNAPFTAREWLGGDFSADRAVTSIGTYNVTAVTGADWGCGLLTFRRSTAAQAITGVGFSPDALLLASVQDVTQAAPVAHARFGIGAADSTFNQGSSALADQDAVATTSVRGIDKTSRAFVKVNTNTATIDAEAVLNGVDPNGFTLDWTTNDAVATEILYLALGTPKPAFARFRSFTVPTSSLGASCTASLSGFPILVSLPSDQELRTVAHGGFVQNASGYDIVFTDAYNNLLDHEIEQYTSAVGGATLVAWVRVPTLSILGSTTIFLRYGNAAITSPTANPAGAWSNGFLGVWHLSEDPSGTAPQLKDSTTGDDETTSGAMTTVDQVSGQIDGSLDFDGGDDRAATGANNLMANLPAFTVSAWVKPTAGQSIYAGVLSYYSAANFGTALEVWNDGLAHAGVETTLGFALTQSPVPLSTAGWSHLVSTYEGTQIALHVNGIRVATTAVAGPLNNYNLPVNIGFNPGDVSHYRGGIDEARIASGARSQCWIETEYKNQGSPGTFGTFGTPAATAVGLMSFEAMAGDGVGRPVVADRLRGGQPRLPRLPVARWRRARGRG